MKNISKTILILLMGIFAQTAQAVIYEIDVWQKRFLDGQVSNVTFFKDVHFDTRDGFLGQKQQDTILHGAKAYNARMLVEDEDSYDDDHHHIKKLKDDFNAGFCKHLANCGELRKKGLLKQFCVQKNIDYIQRGWATCLSGIERKARSKGIECSSVECRVAYYMSRSGRITAGLFLHEHDKAIKKIKRLINTASDTSYQNSEVDRLAFIKQCCTMLQQIETQLAPALRMYELNKDLTIEVLVEKLGARVDLEDARYEPYFGGLLDLLVNLDVFHNNYNKDMFICAGGGHQNISDALASSKYQKVFSTAAHKDFKKIFSFKTFEPCLQLIEKFELQPVFDFLKNERVKENLRVKRINENLKRYLVVQGLNTPALADVKETLKPTEVWQYVQLPTHSSMRTWIEARKELTK